MKEKITYIDLDKTPEEEDWLHNIRKNREKKEAKKKLENKIDKQLD